MGLSQRPVSATVQLFSMEFNPAAKAKVALYSLTYCRSRHIQHSGPVTLNLLYSTSDRPIRARIVRCRAVNFGDLISSHITPFQTSSVRGSRAKNPMFTLPAGGSQIA